MNPAWAWTSVGNYTKSLSVRGDGLWRPPLAGESAQISTLEQGGTMWGGQTQGVTCFASCFTVDCHMKGKEWGINWRTWLNWRDWAPLWGTEVCSLQTSLDAFYTDTGKRWVVTSWTFPRDAAPHHFRKFTSAQKWTESHIANLMRYHWEIEHFTQRTGLRIGGVKKKKKKPQNYC